MNIVYKATGINSDIMKHLVYYLRKGAAIFCLLAFLAFKKSNPVLEDNTVTLSKTVATCEVTVEARPDGIMRILTIGNSFSVDAVENYLYDLAKASNKPVIIGSLAIAGGSLDQHLSNARNNSNPYIYTKIDVDGVKTTTFDNAIEPILTSERWDYISFQQVSQNSGMYSTFVTPLPAFFDYVKRRAKNRNVKYVLHQTWAYAQNSGHSGFANYGNDQLTMYNAIVDTYNKAQQLTGIDIIIPAGTAIQNGRTSFIGDNFTRDGYHLEETYGRYTAACTWFEKLFGESVVGNSFKPSGVSDYKKEIAQHAAHFAVLEPNKVTRLEDYQQGASTEEGEGVLLLSFGGGSAPGWNSLTKYICEGANEVSISLNGSNNTSNLACAEAVQPNDRGEKNVTITMGAANNNANGFYYINALRVTPLNNKS